MRNRALQPSSSSQGPPGPIDSRRRRRALVAALLAAAGGAALATAALPPEVAAGTELVVTPHGHFPSVAVDAQGRGVVAWVDPGSSTSSELFAILARRFDAASLGAPFAVNTRSQGDLRDPKVAMDGAGGFTVVWADASQTPEARTSIRGQLFRRDGRRRGGELGLSPRGVAATHPELAVARDGRFAVAYEQSHWDPMQSVRLATFTSRGAPLAGPLVMGARGWTANLVGAVAAGPHSVAIGWTEFTPCPSNPIDPVSAIGTFDWSLRALHDVERLANDNPCVDGPQVLALPNSDYGPLGIFVGRRYSIQRFSGLDGSRVGLRINVAELPACSANGCERALAVAGDSRGRFVFIWERLSANGDYNLFAELYGREGQVRLARFEVNDGPAAAAMEPAAAFAADGTLWVAWHQEGEGILMRRFELP